MFVSFLSIVVCALASDQVHRTDIVYAESFGTIETTMPYASNQYIHYHVFATQAFGPNICALQPLPRVLKSHLKMIEVRFTRFQLENKENDECNDYVQFKYRDIVPENWVFSHL